MGAGVAGLQAIATARRLGAVVSAYDVRADVKEQVQSLGGKFIEIELAGGEGAGGYAKEMGEEFYRKQREALTSVIAASDVVITTAAIPGKKSPTLVTADMVKVMPPGSVIVDLAADRGGNCELTKPGETVVAHGVTIVGPLNLASDVPRHASQMYSHNVAAFLKEVVKDGRLTIDMTNEVVAGTLVTHRGKCVHAKVRELANLPPLAEEEAAERKAARETRSDEPTAPENIFGGDSVDGDTYRLSGP
jgi:NAD(P) transhydrogenase subunit alpha